MQILSGKSDCDKYLNKNTGLMDKEEIEHSTKVETIEEYLFTRRDIAEYLTGCKARGKYWIVIEW